MVNENLSCAFAIFGNLISIFFNQNRVIAIFYFEIIL